MVQNARPLASSRSSLTSKGLSGARKPAPASGECKEDIFERSHWRVGEGTQVTERSVAAYPAICKQHKPIARAFGIQHLMDGEDQRAPAGRQLTQHHHHLARLSKIEAVKRLVHQQ